MDRPCLDYLEKRLLLAGDFSNIAITSGQAADLLSGLDDAALVVDDLDDHGLLADSIPFIEQSIGATIDFGGIFDNQFVQPINSYFGSDGTPTSDELVAALNGLGGTFGDVTIVVDTGVTDGGLKTDAVNGDTIAFCIKFTATRDVAVPLNFGESGGPFGLNAPNADLMPVTATADFELTFGIDLSPGLAASDVFFITPTNLDVGVDFTPPANYDFDLDVGFLGAEIQTAAWGIDAHANVAFNNPDADATGRITATELLGTTLDSLVGVTPTQAPEVSVSLPIHSSLPGFSVTGGTALEITGDPFDPENLSYQFNGPDSAELTNFLRATDSNVLGVLSAVGGWLTQMTGTSVFNKPVPLSDGSTLASLAELGGMFDATIVDGLSVQAGVASFNTAQEMSDAIEALIGPGVNLSYNTSSNQLSFTFDFNEALVNESAPLSMGYDISPIANLQTTGNGTVQATGDVDFRLILDLSEFMAQVTAATAFAANGHLNSAATFQISTDGINYTPVVVPANTSNTNRAQLITQINDALALAGVTDVTASQTGGKLRLTATGLTEARIHLTADALDSAVTELKLDETMLDVDNLLMTSMLDDITLKGSAAISASGVGATADFGLVEIGASGVTANASAMISAIVRNPSSPSAPMLFSKLYEAASDPGTFAVVTESGSATVTLPNITINSSVGIGLGASPQIEIQISDVFDPNSASLNYTDLNGLLEFEHLDAADIVTALSEMTDFFAVLDTFSFVGDNLPGLSESIGDLLDLSSDFGTKVAAFAANPGETLDEIEANIETLFGLNPSDLALSWSSDELRFDLDWSKTFNDQRNLVFDTAGFVSDAGGNANLAGVGSIFGASGSSQVSTAIDIAADLAFGLNLSNPSSPAFFLHDSTTAALSADLDGTGLSFEASLGPLGAFVVNGSFDLSDGAGGGATFALTLDDETTDDKYTAAQVTAGIFNLSASGRVDATLPIAFPTQGSPTEDLILTVTDISDPTNTTTITGPDLASQFDAIDLINDMNAVREGIKSGLQKLDEALGLGIFTQSLPVVGTSLADAIDFLSDIESALSGELSGTQTAALVKTAIAAAFGEGGTGTLKDTQPDGNRDENDITQTDFSDGMGGTEAIQYDFVLEQTLVAASVPLGFDLGLPGLGLSVDDASSVDVMVGYEFAVGFGVSKTEGFYINTAGSDELTVSLEATIPGLAATATLGFLQLDITDSTANPSILDLDFTVDLLDPIGGNNRLTTDELVSGAASLGDIIDVELTGVADVNLDLVTSLGGNTFLPSLDFELNLDWVFTSSDFSGTSLDVAFNNIELNLGEFFSSFISPVVDQVNTILGPIEPVLDFLTDPIPLINQSLLDLLSAFNPSGFGKAQDFIEAIAQIADLVNHFDTVGPNTVIDLGGFDFDGLDLRTQSITGAFDPIANLIAPGTSIENQINTKAGNFSSAADAVNGGLSIPLLDNPAIAFNLLLGRDIDLLTYDMPEFKVGAEFSFIVGAFTVGPVPVVIKAFGGVDFSFLFGFGYDTHGIRQAFETGSPGALFDGFYVSDLRNGVDVPEVSITGKIGVSASASVVIAEIGAKGGIKNTIDLNLNDVDGDGKMRGSEIIELLGQSIFCLFDTSGRVSFFIDVFVEVGICPFCVEFDVNIIDVTLLEFSFGCDDEPPKLATLDPNTGVLRLNMGPFASAREHVNTTDGDEVFEVTRFDDGTVFVSAFDFKQLYGASSGEPGAVAVTKIVGDGGNGNDQILIEGGVNIDADIRGGVGNDILSGADGNDLIQGDGGEDEITGALGDDDLYGHSQTNAGDDNAIDYINGGMGNDTLDGGGGNDQLMGGMGIDTIHGRQGDDKILGAAGDDFLFGDEGEDIIFGEDGDDEIDGGADDDTLYGSTGNDIIEGGAGSDLLVGGADDDELYGHSISGSGDDNASDKLWGDFGDGLPDDQHDPIAFGSSGDDLLVGQGGDDFIYGEAGADEIRGGGGSDFADGGSGIDVIYGGAGADLLLGGSADDLMYGEDGNDGMLGGAGDDAMYGGEGNDTMRGQEGRDVVIGENGDDNVYGDAGDDIIRGGAGNDTLQGVIGDDVIWSGDGNDTVFGGLHDDHILGEDGNDTIFGNAGNDVIDAGAGVDTVYGNEGDDQLIANAGLGTVIYGGDGDDEIFGTDEGGEDPNLLDGNYFGDLLYGNAGDDRIWGLGGADIISGGAGNDWIDGGMNGDLIRGDDDDDTILGGYGDDDLRGGEGHDQIFGEFGNDVLAGENGDDFLDGGTGVDVLNGGNGDDELVGGGGVGDTLNGDAGEDVLHGSDDGADFLNGGPGDDTIFGHGGNDIINGGGGNDTIDGGEGDDTISGEAGSDLIIGGADHDVIFGHNASASGDDNAVDYLYGDFGTEGNEPGSGMDYLFGQGGNDLLFGEGGDDLVIGGGGSSNVVESGDPGDDPSTIGSITPTPPPAVVPPGTLTRAEDDLADGENDAVRWAELAESASGKGLAGDDGLSVEPAIAAGAAALGLMFVAWSDTRHGNYDIYLARRDGSMWSMLADSARLGGVSDTFTQSRRPSLAVDASGNPIVAWTEFDSAGNSNIYLKKWDPAANGGAGDWVAVGNSAGGGGISATGGADHAQVFDTPSGITVVWLDDSSGTRQVYAKRFTGGNWVALGTGGASGSGVTNTGTGVHSFDAAASGSTIAVAWSQLFNGVRQIRLLQNAGGGWVQLSGSATAGGISNTTDDSLNPTVSYSTSGLMVAWEEATSRRQQIFAKRYSGSWVAAGTGAAAGTGISDTLGYARNPELVSSGSTTLLTYIDEAVLDRDSNHASVFQLKWTGSQWAEDLTGDASHRGVAPTAAVLPSVQTAIDSNGDPLMAWAEYTADGPETFVIADTLNQAGLFLANGGSDVQDILNNNSLNPGNVILLASGSHDGFTITADDAGVLIIGASDLGSVISGSVVLNGANDVTLQRLTFNSIVTVNNNLDFTAYDNVFKGTLTLNNADNAHVGQNRFQVGGTAVSLTGGPVDVLIRDNEIRAGGTGININAAGAGGDIRRNVIKNAAVGINLAGPFNSIIENNEITGNATGLLYGAPATVSDNNIHQNTTGVSVTTAVRGDSFGFVGTALPNDIHHNTTGVSLTSSFVQDQVIRHNATGVAGSGVVGPDDLEKANDIHRNTTGVNVSGTIQFNRIHHNATGVAAQSGNDIVHNLIYRNTDYGVHITGGSDVNIVHNTLVTETGDNIRADGSSVAVDVRNNILWTEGGYNLYVADDSQAAFSSDYNVLHSESGGTLVHWSVDFNDILDWQEDVHRHDLHSVGTTVVNPTWAKPRFHGLARNDFEVFDLTAGLRLSSPSIDAADPATDLALPAGYANLLSNAGFESGTTNWSVSATSAVSSSSPGAFEGSNYFFSNQIQVGFAEQTVDLLTAGYSGAQIDALDLYAVFSGRVRSDGADEVRVAVEFLDGGNALIETREVLANNTTNRWELVGGRRLIPFGTRKIKYVFTSDRQSGATNNGLLDHAQLFVVDETVAPDIGAYGNTSADIDQVDAHLTLRFPDLYTDWERDRPREIRWDSYGNAGELPVRIDLYQDGPDGPEFVTNIVAATTDDGEYTWIPNNTGVAFSTYDLRIKITLVGDESTYDRSTETFTVPEDTLTFYANDRVPMDNDQYTSAIGDNRNTGKLPDRPKPYPANLLRIYSIGSTETLFVDNGSYIQFDPQVLSGTVGVGDDEGFLFTGPTDVDKTATIAHANQFTTAPIITLDNADFVVLRDLTLSGEQYGLLLNNESTNFTGQNLILNNHTADGMRVINNSSVTLLDNITASNNSGYGLFLDDSDLVSMTGSTFSGNGSSGAHIEQTNNTTIDSSNFTGNGGRGLYVYNPNTVSVTNGIFSGNTDEGIYIGNAVATISNNEAFGNGDEGIQLAGGNTGSVISLNKVTGNGGYGIQASAQFSNQTVDISQNVVQGHNAANRSGVYTTALGMVNENIVFNNRLGIDSSSADVLNNRVHGNTTYGIDVNTSADVIGNVVYNNDTGIRAVNTTAVISNNVLHDHATQAIHINNTAGNGPELFNNTIYEPTANAILINTNADNTALRNNIIRVDGGVALFVDSDSQVGFDSDFNLFDVAGGGVVGNWQGINRATLSDWRNASFQDANSLSQDPLFVNVGARDLHLQSTNGSFHGGSLAPVIDVGTGLPVYPTPVETNDAADSPGIDRGEETFPYANEPAPNGGFINLGAYGNTAQASKSPGQYVTVTRPDGGEIWPAEQTFAIRWRTYDSVSPGNDYPSAVLADSPIGYWRLNEATGAGTAADSSVNLLDGTYNGNPNLDVLPAAIIDGSAANFDDVNDDITIADNAAHKPANITVEAWIRPNGGIDHYDTVVMKTTSTSWTDGYGLWYSSGGNINFFVNNWTGASAVAAPVTSNAWSHVVGTYDGSDVRLYINGVEVASSPYAGGITHSSGPLTIGSQNGNYFWSGDIDEVAIYGSALNSTHVSDHYNEAVGVGDVDIELLKAGVPVLTIADDTFNDGEFLWTIPNTLTPGNDYRVRVTDNTSLLSDDSNADFTITAPINIFYVNDATVEAGDWTTAAGNNGNDGLTPATPKESVRAVLEAYVLGPGDVIRVDNGDYAITANIVIGADDAGVTIEGYHDALYPDRRALIDRGNTATSSYVFELNNADGTTIDHLHLTGANTGVYVANDSDQVTISNNTIFNNDQYGIHAIDTVDQPLIVGNAIYSTANTITPIQDYGLYLISTVEPQVIDNAIHRHRLNGVTINTNGNDVAGTLVQGNRVFDNFSDGLSIYMVGSNGSVHEISDNAIFDNDRYGIVTSQSLNNTTSRVLVAGNTVYGHNGANDQGIRATAQGTVEGNVVFGNHTGIEISRPSAIDNTVYNNIDGIRLTGFGNAIGNRAYGNDYGIHVDGGYGDTINNLAYDNTLAGVYLDDSNATGDYLPEVRSNTLYNRSASGVALLIDSGSIYARVYNNIFSVEAGYAMNVAGDSQIGFVSDYNLFDISGSGDYVLWSGVAVSSLADWIFEVGFGANSSVGDPLFVDPDGADGILGYGSAAIGPAVIVDDADAGFSLDSGSWRQGPALDGMMNPIEPLGYNTNWYEAQNEDPHAVATWSFSGLTPGATYQVAVTWVSIPGNSSSVPYEILDGDDIVARRFVNQTVSPLQFFADGVFWQTIGTVAIDSATLAVSMSNNTNNDVIADAVRIVQVSGDGASDDDFHLSPGSPAIDKGHPSYPHFFEPDPDGGRLNQGAYGNTPEATASPDPLVQVLDPNGLEKFEVNQPVTVDWRSWGLSEYGLEAAFNANRVRQIGHFASLNSYRLDNGLSTNTGSAIDLSAIVGFAGAAPEPVYQYYDYSDFNPGDSLHYQLPIQDGNYTVRLHFMEPDYTTPNQRPMDIYVNGGLIVNDYDIIGFGYNRFQAAVLDLPVTLTGGTGLELELEVEVYARRAVLSGIEIFRDHSAGAPNLTADIEVSNDGGGSYLPVAVGVPMDELGSGTYQWMPTAATDQGLIRVTVNTGALPSDASDDLFQIGNDGTAYYINDNSLVGDEYGISAVGDNANSGKSPDQPMASLSALLDLYDLDPGDTVYVGAGTYLPISNIVINSQDAGVRIQGPVNADATFDRNNPVNGSYTFHVSSADGVELDNLRITGANRGVYLVNSDDFQITNSELFGHDNGYGVYVDADSDNALIDNNEIYGNGGGTGQDYGVYSLGDHTAVTNNDIYSHYAYGIYVSNVIGGEFSHNMVHNNRLDGISYGMASANDVVVEIADNEVYGNDVGIQVYASGTVDSLVEVRDNTIHGNTDYGIYAYQPTNSIQGRVLMTGNEVYNHTNVIYAGIYGNVQGWVVNNEVYGNGRGILGTRSEVIDNRVYDNTAQGIEITNVVARGNVSYSNDIGIQIDSGYGEISNNLVYASATVGIHINDGTPSGVYYPRVYNNTVYQPVGTGVLLDGGTYGVRFYNNIVSVAGGFALQVDPDSQYAFRSDHNIFHITGAATFAQWNGATFTNQADWFHATGHGQYSILADPQFVDPDGADNFLGYDGGSSTDRGLDDNFHVLAGSPAVDGGDPGFPLYNEPAPNGGVINVGAYGNTTEATPSPAEVARVHSPNGLEKYEVGQTVPIAFLTSGIGQRQLVGQWNSGNVALRFEDYFSDVNLKTKSVATAAFSNPVDTSGVLDGSGPAPEYVYQNYAYTGTSSTNNTLAWRLPVADGDYALRLHFAEPSYTTTGQRFFDIYLQNAVVESGVDLVAQGGVQYKALVKEFPVTASGGGGIDLKLVGTYRGAVISGFELLAVDGAGLPAATADVEVSTNGGGSWTTVAAAIPLDDIGRGSHDWIPTVESDQMLARVTVNAGSNPSDASDDLWQVANNGTSYYINDGSLVGDEYGISAVGDDANHGKTPDKPMRTLRALLDLYDLDPGDTIYVGAGNYDVVENILIGSQDAGVRVQGPLLSDAVFERDNSTGSTRFVFQISNSDGVELDRLVITGGQDGVRVSGSANVEISNSTIHDNDGGYGVYYTSTSDYPIVLGNTIYGDANSTGQRYGLRIDSDYAIVSNNEVYDHYQDGVDINNSFDAQVLDNIVRDNRIYGINFDPEGQSSESIMIAGNEIYGNRDGLLFNHSGPATVSQRIQNNIVYDNDRYGIYLTQPSSVVPAELIVENNQVYGHTNPSYAGVYGWADGEFIHNVVHSNAVGIKAARTHVIENQVYNNSAFGIDVTDHVEVLRNRVYSNDVGIRTEDGYGRIVNNLIYANTDIGIHVKDATTSSGRTVRVYNNTVYQPVGEAMLIDDTSVWVSVANNILWVGTGYAINVAPDSQSNFDSDYNLFYKTDPGAFVGRWGGVDQPLLTDWQTASGHDANSAYGDPLFVDIDGADGVLGYTSAGDGYDGGGDDNFFLAKNSPAIDRAYSWYAPDTDITGQPRLDDAGTTDAGSVDYVLTDLGSSQFDGGQGVAQGWRSTGSWWTLNFAGGFVFPIYGKNYSSVFVSTEGFVQFGNNTGITDNTNTTEELIDAVRIAGLWDNLRTNLDVDDDIYVDESVSGQVTIRWNASLQSDGSDVQFAITLFDTGHIRFDYGPGNVGLTPTIGFSGAFENNYVLLPYDGQGTLTNANSIEAVLLTDFEDVGAYEFGGSSLDNTPPVVIGTDPAAVDNEGTVGGDVFAITVTFSEAINPIDALAVSNYELRSNGGNGIFGDSDDDVYILTPAFNTGDDFVVLNIGGAPLPDGDYRLTISGTTSIHDLAGIRMDGDGNAIEGGDYVRFFLVALTPSATIAGRHIFYNNSLADGNDPLANAADDGAIALDKTALLPGETATAANFTSYSRGVNGIMIDVANPAGTPTAADFLFNAGTSGDPNTWAAAPAPQSITVRPGEGVGGSDRVTIIWTDGALANTWLQVTVKATAATGLPADDVFYFGNVVGDTDGDADVDTNDLTTAIINFTGAGGSGKTFADGDTDADGDVDTGDLTTRIINYSGAGNPIIELLTAPALSLPLEAAPVSTTRINGSTLDSFQGLTELLETINTGESGGQEDGLTENEGVAYRVLAI